MRRGMAPNITWGRQNKLVHKEMPDLYSTNPEFWVADLAILVLVDGVDHVLYLLVTNVAGEVLQDKSEIATTYIFENNWVYMQGVPKNALKIVLVISPATKMLEGWDICHLKYRIRSSLWSTISGRPDISKTIWGTRIQDFETPLKLSQNTLEIFWNFLETL